MSDWIRRVTEEINTTEMIFRELTFFSQKIFFFSRSQMKRKPFEVVLQGTCTLSRNLSARDCRERRPTVQSIESKINEKYFPNQKNTNATIGINHGQ